MHEQRAGQRFVPKQRQRFEDTREPEVIVIARCQPLRALRERRRLSDLVSLAHQTVERKHAIERAYHIGAQLGALLKLRNGPVIETRCVRICGTAFAKREEPLNEVVHVFELGIAKPQDIIEPAALIIGCGPFVECYDPAAFVHLFCESLAGRALSLRERRHVMTSTNQNDWEERVAKLWAAVDDYEPDAFRARMAELVAERPAGDPLALFELASAYDSTGHSDKAVPLYREALAAGLGGVQRRRAVIQMASSLRNLGEAHESVALLSAERTRGSDELDDAVAAFLALALVDTGREREAVSLALRALARHLPRYNRSLSNYAKELV